ncbi:MAG: hypothetical protein HPY89_02610 [Pelotomaculum sp.]|uniref:Phage ABA sandwich domain-containing protein n=1 Tax=Pelotomaculum thermopropionicum (strain DSM 13744 / JCM 10971 / SI) TaxID=370438 RepID=A5D128_PELTS|nr:hypothetical protein [Pelotomaculum sp.]BAF60065.1 hypothetical protein PTH_1884 [Pelotomaculum thermopropionicum SI]
MISVELAKKLAKYLPWEPKVGDLTIICGEDGEEIIEPIIPKHEKEKKIVLSLREMGGLVWLPQLARLLYELKNRTDRGFSLIYDKPSNKWCYRDGTFETCSENSPEDAAAQALLKIFESGEGR